MTSQTFDFGPLSATGPTPVQSLIGQIIEFEDGLLTEEQTVDLFNDLIETGLIYQLQGHYGRMAQAMIDAGLIAPA